MIKSLLDPDGRSIVDMDRLEQLLFLHGQKKNKKERFNIVVRLHSELPNDNGNKKEGENKEEAVIECLWLTLSNETLKNKMNFHF